MSNAWKWIGAEITEREREGGVGGWGERIPLVKFHLRFPHTCSHRLFHSSHTHDERKQIRVSSFFELQAAHEGWKNYSNSCCCFFFRNEQDATSTERHGRPFLSFHTDSHLSPSQGLSDTLAVAGITRRKQAVLKCVLKRKFISFVHQLPLHPNTRHDGTSMNSCVPAVWQNCKLVQNQWSPWKPLTDVLNVLRDNVVKFRDETKEENGWPELKRIKEINIVVW